MRLPFLVLLSVLGALVHAEPMEINPRDLSGFVYSRSHFFVFVYAPWCAHCVAAKPEFESIESHVPTIMVDGSIPEASVMRERYGIKAFPTFLLFENAQPKEIYTGYRTAEAFEQFLNEKVPKPSDQPEVASTEDSKTTEETTHDEL